jgi:hypothetical protein
MTLRWPGNFPAIFVSASRQASLPVLFKAPGRPPSPSAPSKAEGDGAPSGAPVFLSCRTPNGECGRLPALHRGFSVPGTVTSGRATEDFSSRAFARFRPLRVQPFKADPRRGAGRLPEASRVRGYEPRPQAPHPIPSSKRLAKTPLGGPDDVRLYTLGILSRALATKFRSSPRKRGPRGGKYVGCSSWIPAYAGMTGGSSSLHGRSDRLARSLRRGRCGSDRFPASG